MSPAPARTSRAAIIGAGRELLEERGLEGVTMATVAERVGVRAPSLYKHVADRRALVTAIIVDAADELEGVIRAATPAPPADPAAVVRAIADAYRGFAHRAPRAVSLLFLDLGPDAGPPHEDLARAAEPVLSVAATLAGEAHALPAARVLTAFVHGFTSMESANAFRLGGHVDEAWRLGLDALVIGLARNGSA